MSEGIAAVIVAAGRSERLGGAVPKQFLDLGGLPVLEWSLRSFHAHPAIGAVVAVVPLEEAEGPPPWLAAAAARGIRLVAGGRTRAESVVRGVAGAPADAVALLVHDGARPFAGASLIARVAAAARTTAVIPVLPVVDTIKRVDAGGRVVATVDRGALRRAQTPQGFPGPLLRRLHAAGSDAVAAVDVTDDALLCERAGHPVDTVGGDPLNLKITGPRDLRYARWLVETGVIEAPTWT